MAHIRSRSSCRGSRLAKACIWGYFLSSMFNFTSHVREQFLYSISIDINMITFAIIPLRFLSISLVTHSCYNYSLTRCCTRQIELVPLYHSFGDTRALSPGFKGLEKRISPQYWRKCLSMQYLSNTQRVISFRVGEVEKVSPQTSMRSLHRIIRHPLSFLGSIGSAPFQKCEMRNKILKSHCESIVLARPSSYVSLVLMIHIK